MHPTTRFPVSSTYKTWGTTFSVRKRFAYISSHTVPSIFNAAQGDYEIYTMNQTSLSDGVIMVGTKSISNIRKRKSLESTTRGLDRSRSVRRPVMLMARNYLLLRTGKIDNATR